MNDTSPSSPLGPGSMPPPYPPYPYPPYQAGEDEINLIGYWRIVVRYRAMIITIIALATAVAATVAVLMTPLYRAEVLLAPVSDDQQSSLSAIASQFSGLASLAGVNLGSGTSNTDQLIATLTSRSFIDAFITENGLMPILFADKWDAASKAWNAKSPDEVPTAGKAYSLFSEILEITSDKRTGIVTLAIEWKDPQQSASWANNIVRRINRYERQRAIDEAQQSIAYLNAQLAQTSVVELQQAMYRLLEVQTKKIMLANVRNEFAFQVIDPAVPPERKAKPRRALITAGGFAAGFILAIFIAFLRAGVVSHQQRE